MYEHFERADERERERGRGRDGGERTRMRESIHVRDKMRE